jgi:hypothetical protein
MPLLLCVCGLLLRAQAATPQTEVLLKFQPPVGKTYKYVMAMDMSMEAGAQIPTTSFKTSVDFDLNVLSKKDDLTTIESKTSNAVVTVPPDSPMAAAKDEMIKKMNGQIVKSDIDSSFHPHNVKGSQVDAMLNSLQGLSFPDHAIKVGESWKATMDLQKYVGAAMGSTMPGMKMTGDMPIVNKLTSVDVVNGASVATINMSMKGDLTVSFSGIDFTMQIVAGGDYKLDVATGTMVSMNMTSDNKISGASGNMNQHIIQSMKLR